MYNFDNCRMEGHKHRLCMNKDTQRSNCTSTRSCPALEHTHAHTHAQMHTRTQTHMHTLGPKNVWHWKPINSPFILYNTVSLGQGEGHLLSDVEMALRHKIGCLKHI